MVVNPNAIIMFWMDMVTPFVLDTGTMSKYVIFLVTFKEKKKKKERWSVFLHSETESDLIIFGIL